MSSLPGTLQVGFTEKERERLSFQAQSRDLSDGTFVRLLVAGALAIGGPRIDALLAAGEKSVPITHRHGRNFQHDWEHAGYGRWLHKSNKWLLVKHAPTARSKDDPSGWWMLEAVDNSVPPRPIAYRSRDALRSATLLLEGNGDG